jgi:hypothetical protein
MFSNNNLNIKTTAFNSYILRGDRKMSGSVSTPLGVRNAYALFIMEA